MAYKKTHRVRRRTKHQKRRSLKRKIVKYIKGTKRRGGGPGDPPGFDLEKYYKNKALDYKDKTFTIINGSELDSGWKLDVHTFGYPVIRADLIKPKIRMYKPPNVSLGVYVSFEELEKYNDWFKINPPSLESSAPPSLESSAPPSLESSAKP